MEENDINPQSDENNYDINSESRIKLNLSKDNNENMEEDIFSKLNSKDKEFEKENYENNEKNENINENANIIKNEENTKTDINYISEENLSVIKSKIEYLEKKYSFSIKYSNLILNFINLFNELLYEQINNSKKYNLNNISFFDKLSKLYSDLIYKLKNSDEKKIISLKILF